MLPVAPNSAELSSHPVAPPLATQIWKGFHWVFFVNVQGLIICLRRFELAVMADDLAIAQTELQTATDLMLASGAAMQLAGSFSRQEYDQAVRPSMTPPFVESDNFSGLMCWEHAVLVKIWQRLIPVFNSLPAALTSQHEQFVSAYGELARSHRAVCAKFGGDEGGSLRFEQHRAVDTLDKFAQVRQSCLNPRSRCPMHRGRDNS
jgi:hypothetical protein